MTPDLTPDVRRAAEAAARFLVDVARALRRAVDAAWKACRIVVHAMRRAGLVPLDPVRERAVAAGRRRERRADRRRLVRMLREDARARRAAVAR